MAKIKTIKTKPKSIKIGDLISYLFSDVEKIPQEFIEDQKNVSRYVIYLLEYIWHFPKMINYFQKYNHLYNREMEQDPLNFLIFFKKVINENINRYQFKAEFFNFYQELQKVKKIEDEAAKQKRQFIDVITEMKIGNLKNQEVKLHEVKEIKNAKKDQNIIDKIKQAQENQIESKKDQNKIFLKELNEDIINKLELTLIDTFTDEKHNQMIYIFLNKDFKKCYYIEKFEWNFYISKEFSIIQNDYLEPYDPEKFIKYNVYNVWDYNNLRRSINYSYKSFMTR